MKSRQLIIIILFSIVLSACSDEQLKEHRYKTHLGSYFDYGRWHGNYYTDQNGNKFLYRPISTTITNDSTIPLNIKLKLLSEYKCNKELNYENLKIFILPKNLGEDKQYNDPNVSKELKSFLDSELHKPTSLNEIINPNEGLVITLGILQKNGPNQMALISNGHKPYFTDHDSIITKFIKKQNPLELFVGLDFFRFTKNDSIYSSYLIIPCGQMSFIKK
jgi:hypothetical protein